MHTKLKNEVTSEYEVEASERWRYQGRGEVFIGGCQPNTKVKASGSGKNRSTKQHHTQKQKQRKNGKTIERSLSEEADRGRARSLFAG